MRLQRPRRHGLARSSPTSSAMPTRTDAGARRCWRISARRSPASHAARATTASSRAPNATRRSRRRSCCRALLRIREASGFDMGITHAIDVLLGEENDKIWRMSHDRLSTFGIGTDLDRRGWRHLAEELVRLGLIDRDTARYNVAVVTAAGRRALGERAPITIREIAAPVRSRAAKRSRAATVPVGHAKRRRGGDVRATTAASARTRRRTRRSRLHHL